MSDQIENHVFKVDGCLEVGQPAYSYDIAMERMKRDFPRGRSFEYVGIRELHTFIDRKRPVEAQESRPEVHRSPVKPKKSTFKGGHADAATMADIEDSVVKAYGSH